MNFNKVAIVAQVNVKTQMTMITLLETPCLVNKLLRSVLVFSALFFHSFAAGENAEFGALYQKWNAEITSFYRDKFRGMEPYDIKVFRKWDSYKKLVALDDNSNDAFIEKLAKSKGGMRVMLSYLICDREDWDPQKVIKDHGQPKFGIYALGDAIIKKSKSE